MTERDYLLSVRVEVRSNSGKGGQFNKYKDENSSETKFKKEEYQRREKQDSKAGGLYDSVCQRTS